MVFIELTHHYTKKKISIVASKIVAVFEANLSYDNATRISVDDSDYFDVDESYETVMEMIHKVEISNILGS